jgi:hypothetical protein
VSTARDMIESAFTATQLYAPGEIVTDADLAQGFYLLNSMIDSWSGESLLTFATLKQSTTLVPGTYQYTIGPGGWLDTVRPLRILFGYGTAWITDPVGNRYPLTILNEEQWNQIGNIAQVNSNVPIYLFYDPQFPQGVLNFFPIPNIGWTATWSSYAQLSRFPTVDVDVFLPPGYERALWSNLALELEPYYDSAVIKPGLRQTAAQSKAIVKRTNSREVIAQYDPEIVSRSRASYNIYRDGPA